MMRMVFLFIAALLIPHACLGQTAITASGSYGGGDYKLTAGISTSINNTSAYTAALTFTGAATLDLNCHVVSNSVGSGNPPNLSVGVRGLAALTIFDSCGTGRIEGYLYGAILDGAGSKLLGVNLSENLYAGAWIVGDNSTVIGGRADNISGTTHEPYATGIQVGGNGFRATGFSCHNLYRQPGVGGTGEGVCINLTSGTANGEINGLICDNDAVMTNTYCVFAGGSSSKIINNVSRNFWRGFAISTIGTPIAQRNIGILESPLAGSEGLGCESCGSAEVSRNVMIGFADAYSHTQSPTPTDQNLGLTFPGFPSPPEPTFGGIFGSSLTGSFGNVDTKTIRVTVAASALTLPAGPVTKIRVTLRAHADEPITYSKMYVGHSSGSGNGTGLVQMKVGGATSWTIPARQSVVAEADFAYNKTSGLLFSSYHNGGVNSDRLAANAAVAAAVTYHKYGDEAASGTISGLAAVGGYLSGIESIETDGF